MAPNTMNNTRTQIIGVADIYGARGENQFGISLPPDPIKSFEAQKSFALGALSYLCQICTARCTKISPLTGIAYASLASIESRNCKVK